MLNLLQDIKAIKATFKNDTGDILSKKISGVYANFNKHDLATQKKALRSTLEMFTDFFEQSQEAQHFFKEKYQAFTELSVQCLKISNYIFEASVSISHGLSSLRLMKLLSIALVEISSKADFAKAHVKWIEASIVEIICLMEKVLNKLFNGDREKLSYLEDSDLFQLCKLTQEQISFITEKSSKNKKYFKVLAINSNKDEFFELLIITYSAILILITKIRSCGNMKIIRDFLKTKDEDKIWEELLNDVVVLLLLSKGELKLSELSFPLTKVFLLECDRYAKMRDSFHIEDLIKRAKFIQGIYSIDSSFLQEPLMKMNTLAGYLQNDLGRILAGKQFFILGGQGDQLFSVLLEFISLVHAEASKRDSRVCIIKQKFLNYFYMEKIDTKTLGSVIDFATTKDLGLYAVLFAYAYIQSSFKGEDIEDEDPEILIQFFEAYSDFLESSYKANDLEPSKLLLTEVDLSYMEDIVTKLRVKKSFRKNKGNLEIMRLYFWLFIVSTEQSDKDSADNYLAMYFRHGSVIRNELKAVDELLQLSEDTIDFFLHVCNTLCDIDDKENIQEFYEFFEDACSQIDSFESSQLRAKKQLILLKVRLAQGKTHNNFERDFEMLCKELPPYQIYTTLKPVLMDTQYFPMLFFQISSSIYDNGNSSVLLDVLRVLEYLSIQIYNEGIYEQIFSCIIAIQRVYKAIEENHILDLYSWRNLSNLCYNFGLAVNDGKYDQKLVLECFTLSVQLLVANEKYGDDLVGESWKSQIFTASEANRFSTFVEFNEVQFYVDKILSFAYIVDRTVELNNLIDSESNLKLLLANALNKINPEDHPDLSTLIIQTKICLYCSCNSSIITDLIEVSSHLILETPRGFINGYIKDYPCYSKVKEEQACCVKYFESFCR